MNKQLARRDVLLALEKKRRRLGGYEQPQGEQPLPGGTWDRQCRALWMSYCRWECGQRAEGGSWQAVEWCRTRTMRRGWLDVSAR